MPTTFTRTCALKTCKNLSIKKEISINSSIMAAVIAASIKKTNIITTMNSTAVLQNMAVVAEVVEEEAEGEEVVKIIMAVVIKVIR